MLTSLLPAGVDPLLALLLIGLSFVTSMITATFSLGGGLLMVAVLALVFPPAVVVPVHGAVQLGSNAGRAVVQRDHIQWHLIVWIRSARCLESSSADSSPTCCPSICSPSSSAASC
ncbi:MAG: hypothetical protein J0I48_21600 [Devosia sp.]|uniref:hypothetical protein n=1 Tax=Devosia sp. 66-22 TaxID=1895753 RepID=UPI001AC79067|nr:hypothetical protein [Devosia sp. 66-22]MBN9348765.1 hypothetical protein [Devosia sp.]